MSEEMKNKVTKCHKLAQELFKEIEELGEMFNELPNKDILEEADVMIDSAFNCAEEAEMSLEALKGYGEFKI